ncbi:MAG: Rieske 2Fe-2S domain-containing protein [Chloroflexi bacterium]|nr:Rieske 2Fe-2S domain-containing protein [Chloroflexota bacterium]
MLVKLAEVGEIAPGGMKLVEAGGEEIVLCNCGGKYFALARRCGHMNSPLEMGSLDGTILTCPMHHVQFNVTTGEALNYPIPGYIDEPLPDKWAKHMSYLVMLMQHITVCDIRTLPVTIQGTSIHVAIG